MKKDGEVNWANLNIAKDALSRWATAECLKIQEEDLKVQENVVGKRQDQVKYEMKPLMLEK